MAPSSFRLFKLNKKGEANDANIPAVMLYYMMASFIIVILIFGFASILTGWQNQVSEFPDELKGEIIALRFSQSVDCFAYSDPVSGKVYPGVIDLEKFKDSRMDTCYFTGVDGQDFFQFELSLPEYKKTVETDNNYRNLIDHTIEKQILVYDEGKFVPTKLFIYVQTRI
ncbi:hypothetical protein HOA92_04355 [archaeon]|nr:hypothetical protein [archaeon]